LNLYENVVILDASVNDETVEAEVQKFKDLITGAGGTILKSEVWGRRKMAYAINKHSRGCYIFFLFHAPSSLIRKMEETFKVDDLVVNFLLVRLEKKQREITLKTLEAEKQPAPAAPAAETTEAPKAETTEAPKAETTEAPKAEAAGQA
jgi:small subunit ribosomal protein S6